MVRQEVTIEGIKAGIRESLRTDKVLDSLWQLSPVERTPEAEHGLEFIGAGTVFIMGQVLFPTYSRTIRELYNLAVVETVRDWNRKEYGTRFLNQAAHLVALTRTKAAIWPLMDQVEEDLVNYQDADSEEVLSTSVAVIAGFSPSEEVRQILQPWIFDPRFERQTAVLMNGLSECSPREYPIYLERWMEVGQAHPDYFKPKPAIHELVRVVGLPTIKSKLGRIPQKYRTRFEELLKENNFSL